MESNEKNFPPNGLKFVMYRRKVPLYSFKSTFIYLAIGLLLILVSLLLYFNKSYLDILMMIIGLGNCGVALFKWYFSPRRITLENDCLVVDYANKSKSISADEIEDIQIGRTKQTAARPVGRLTRKMQIKF